MNEDVTTHLMKHLSLHPTLRTCSADTILRAIEELTFKSITNALRSRGIAADVAPTAAKLGKQIKYADKLGIPFVWFPGQEGAGDEVKNIVSGEQRPADRTSWEPDTVNARQTVVID